MHYFENETIMSCENAYQLKPSEILVLEHVRTYEFADEERPLGSFIEIHCYQDTVVVRKNRIINFPLFEVEEERSFSTVEEATDTFRHWIKSMEPE